MTYIWNDPPADETFWHSCATVDAATTVPGFDLTAIVVPPEYDALVAVEANGFDLSA
jgi:hypothetical protein